MGFSKEFKWIERYVDVKGLANVIMKRAKKVEVKGLNINPRGLYIDAVLDEIRVQVMNTIASVEYVEAKLKLEKERTGRALKEAENMGTTD